MARKPLSGTVAGNVLEHGVGALNIDGTRIHTEGSEGKPYTVKRLKPGATLEKTGGNWRPESDDGLPWEQGREYAGETQDGRWPANVVLSHTEGCVQVGTRKVKQGTPTRRESPVESAYFGADKKAGHEQRPYVDADGTETVGAWSCTPGYRVPAFTLGGLSVALGISPEQEVEDLLALVLHRVRASGSHTAGTRTAPAHGPSDDRWPSSPQDSPGDCPACLRCGDAHARLTAVVGQASAQLLADVLESVLHPRSSPPRSRASSPADLSNGDGSDPTSTGTHNPPSRTAEAQPVAAPSAARTPSDTKHTLPSPSPRAGLRGSTQPSSTSEASDEARAIPCHSGHRCSGFLPLVSACLTSLRAYVPLSVEHIEWGGCPVRLLDEQTGELTSGAWNGVVNQARVEQPSKGAERERPREDRVSDSGGASRFFYVAKASRAERNAGLEGFEERVERWNAGPLQDTPRDSRTGEVYERKPRANHHPTVKPISLMRWLVRLVTPPGGTVLDPFTGSGTTGCACALEAFDFVGLEREPEYVAIAEARIRWWHKHRGDGEASDILAAGEARDEVEATGQLGMFD